MFIITSGNRIDLDLFYIVSLMLTVMVHSDAQYAILLLKWSQKMTFKDALFFALVMYFVITLLLLWKDEHDNDA